MTMDEMILDTLASCTYASAYWAGCLDYEKKKLTNGKKFECFEDKLLDCLKNGGVVTYYDIDDNTPYEVTYEKMESGINKLLRKHKSWDVIEDYSDEILQFCIFGKVVFS